MSGSIAGFGRSSPLFFTPGMPLYQSWWQGLGFSLQILPFLVVFAAGGLSEASGGVGTLLHPIRRVRRVFI